MTFIVAMLALSATLATVPAFAQPPTGAIAGIATDATGAVVVAVAVQVMHLDTRQVRAVATSDAGRYLIEALPVGPYRIVAEILGFKRREQVAVVEAGTTTTVNLDLETGDLDETVVVAAVAPLLRYDQHQVSGVVHRTQVEQLPLNGRNVFELAKLEPGMTSPLRLADNRTFIPSLGAGLQTIPRVGYTRVTVDGASLTTPATTGTLLQVSQEVVQEFQVATVNFDPATSLTTNGSVNVITRSGGNAYRGGGFSFYRDHHLSAYPGLRREATNPNPRFRRHQWGSFLGGPVLEERAFFFASHERIDQSGVLSIQPTTPEFAHLGGLFATPYAGNLFSGRADVRLKPSHHMFVRHTRDHSTAVAGAVGALPSAWSNRSVNASQTVAALTSVLSSHVVNELRVSRLSTDSRTTPITASNCPGCFGLGAPRVTVLNSGIVFGEGPRASARGHRLQLTSNLSWQLGSHRLRLGADWEHVTNVTSTADRDPAHMVLWAPDRVRQVDPAIHLPTSFNSVEEFLQLPLRSFETAVGPPAVYQRDFGRTRVQDLLRMYVSDSWQMTARLTLNGGVSWSYEPNALNYDLTKPALLRPILGDQLDPPAVQTGNISPSLGLVWTATGDRKTVVRIGAGRYFDPVSSGHLLNLDNERRSLLPAGTGRLIESGANVIWEGRSLDFRQPTSFTGAQLLSILPGIRDGLAASINPDNRDDRVRAIDVTKQGANLYDPAYSTPSALHFGIGVQRELAPGLSINADVVRKQFVHTFINGIDYNRFDSAGGPIIPRCTPAQRNDVHAVCSNGRMFFDTTIGRAVYNGVLLRAEKRFAAGGRLLASYALGSFVGSNGTGTGTSEAPGGRVFGFNNDNWFENYGPMPTDQRHVANLSGVVELPWHLSLAANVSAYSAPPFTAYVADVDFNGDGTINDLLPGTTINAFGRSLDRGDLTRLVEAYNRQYGGKLTAAGHIAPFVTLPENYAFEDGMFTLDVRLTRTFPVKAEAVRLAVLAEVFNLLNTANLVQFSGNLANTSAFGQPSARFSQVFGSGGPRAVQLGLRVSF